MKEKITKRALLGLLLALAIILLVVNNRNFFKAFSLSSFSQGEAKSYKQIFEFCENNLSQFGSKENCYAKEFNDLASLKGSSYSFKVLTDLQQKDKKAIGCHLIAHGIGAGSYSKDPVNWRQTIQQMPTICNYGAIHGVIESYIGSLPDKSLSREIIPTICGETPRADCNHIVGHLLLVETEANTNKALDLCGVFRDPRQNAFCISGVFMEYQTALNLIEHNLVPRNWLDWPKRLPDLEKMCRSYTGANAEGCWEEIVHVALVTFKNDPQKIFDFCNSAQTQVGAKKCKRHSIGVMGASKNFDLEVLKPMCAIPQPNDPSFEHECYPALVSSALSTIPKMLPEAVKMCNGLESQFQLSCFQMIGAVSHADIFKRTEIEKACKNVNEEMRNYCLGTTQPRQAIPLRSND